MRAAVLAVVMMSSLTEPGVGSAAASSAQQVETRRIRTSLFDVAYTVADEADVRAFLGRAEAVYYGVDSLLFDALPASLSIWLTADAASKETAADLVIDPRYAGPVELILADRMARVAARRIVGATYDADGYAFFNEGLAAWVTERYERAAGIVRPRWLWAAYAYVQEASYLEYMEGYSLAVAELGRNVAGAVGYSFVVYFISQYGRPGLESLLQAMSDNIDLCSALGDAGFDCDAVQADWEATLESEAAKQDFSNLPIVQADLFVRGDDEEQEAAILVRVVNPETEEYSVFVQYALDDEYWEEALQADGHELQRWMPLGPVESGARVLWEAAVWSDSLQDWVTSGWQDRKIE
jgi:hypothetical protein